MNTCTVYVRAKDGHFILGHVTAANSVFEAAQMAWPGSRMVAMAKRTLRAMTRFWKSDRSLTTTTSTTYVVARYGTRLSSEASIA